MPADDDSASASSVGSQQDDEVHMRLVAQKVMEEKIRENLKDAEVPDLDYGCFFLQTASKFAEINVFCF
jgi:hypothetical protein